MSTPFFSVIVLTYNSDWDKTRRTLYSILKQKNVEFELIVTDDGSKENNYDRIRAFFASYDFTNYYLVDNKQNQGTVRNLLSGINYCKGEYIKPISPGDFLYDDNILRKTHDYICKGSAAVYFERACYYSVENGHPVLYASQANPRDVRPYLKREYEKIKRNYLAYSDLILGASVIYKAEPLRDYLNKVCDCIKYAEDNVIIYMLAKGERVEYLSEMEYGVWYEYMSGISMGNDSVWLGRVANDRRSIVSRLYFEHSIPFWLYILNITPNWILRQIIKLLYTPGVFIWRYSKIKGYDKVEPNMQYLKRLLDV